MIRESDIDFTNPQRYTDAVLAELQRGAIDPKWMATDLLNFIGDARVREWMISRDLIELDYVDEEFDEDEDF
jgi:hypothetical protein